MQTLHEQEPAVTSLSLVNQTRAEDQTQEPASAQAEKLAPSTTATRKRLVSKGYYAANITEKAALFTAFTGIVLFGVLGLIVACVCLLALTQTPAAELVAPLWEMLALFGGGGMVLLYFGGRALKEVKQIEVGVPLTRANTAALSANDSLVRASQEPAQAQEGVLLRAASGETQAGQKGQLLRAAAGHE